MAVTSAMIKELREKTGVGMMDCKKALIETDGDMEKAVVYLREKGLASASARADKIASEGLVLSYVTEDNKNAAIVEVNSETDFVAKNQDFRGFVSQVAKQAATTTASDLDSFLNDKWELDPSFTISDALKDKIAVIGENLQIRRFAKITKSQPGALTTYIHGEGKIAVLVELACEKEDPALMELGKNVAMQIAALNAKFISREYVDPAFLEEEKNILKTQAMNDEKNKNKPENIIEKMIEGRLNKELKELCLVDQEYFKNSDQTVGQYIEAVAKEVGCPIKILSYTRFETGEGIEKKVENFADEVSKAMQ